jgi:RHS repeat-associated protein
MSHRKRLAPAATVLVLLFVTSAVTAQQSKFQSSQETGGVPGRYRVQLELRPGDDLAAISSQLAATYGARIEPFAQEGFTGFAIIATPARARLMSSDPRVVAIVDLDPLQNPDRPRQAEPAEPLGSGQAKTPAAETEQVRMVLTSEAVPGFGNYTYDGSGNITSIDDQVFRYDAFGRLQSAVLGSFESQAYTYDRYGNILKIVTDGDDVNAARMSVDPETNQMDLPFSGSNPANMIATYDDVGNVITHQGTFIYDALNMMKETTDTARRLHVYSASDERVMVLQAVNGVETTSEWTLRDGSNRVLRRLTKDAAGVWYWKEDYIYGGARLLAAEVPGPERVRHFYLDHLGTPRLITGNGGARIAEKTYRPFGGKVSGVTDDFEQLEFTGHERDMPALDYMHARYYQPDLGRFLSVDPLIPRQAAQIPQIWNRYTYVRNNPIGSSDPTGLVDNCVAEETTDAKGKSTMRLRCSVGETSTVKAKRPRFSLFSGPWFPRLQVALTRHDDQSRMPAYKPNKAQCKGLTEVLNKEAEHGTTTAANMSSNTWGDRSTLASFNNDFNGPNDPVRSVRMSNGDVLDVDWYTDIRSYGSSYPALFYALGKGGLWKGRNVGMGEDPGERTAVRYIREGRGYSDIFTPAYMDQNCE